MYYGWEPLGALGLAAQRKTLSRQCPSPPDIFLHNPWRADLWPDNRLLAAGCLVWLLATRAQYPPPFHPHPCPNQLQGRCVGERTGEGWAGVQPFCAPAAAATGLEATPPPSFSREGWEMLAFARDCF